MMQGNTVSADDTTQVDDPAHGNNSPRVDDPSRVDGPPHDKAQAQDSNLEPNGKDSGGVSGADQRPDEEMNNASYKEMERKNAMVDAAVQTEGAQESEESSSTVGEDGSSSHVESQAQGNNPNTNNEEGGGISVSDQHLKEKTNIALQKEKERSDTIVYLEEPKETSTTIEEEIVFRTISNHGIPRSALQGLRKQVRFAAMGTHKTYMQEWPSYNDDDDDDDTEEGGVPLWE